jgi:hypothetical protein
MVILNKTCRFCAQCDLVIAHQDEIEANLHHLLSRLAPHAVGNSYLVVGTVERKHWRRGLTEPLTNTEMMEALDDFKDHVRFKPAPTWALHGPPPKPK